MTPLEKLGEALQAIADSERGGPPENQTIWDSKPDRWWDNAHWRCVNDHVSTCLLSTERGKVCLACYAFSDWSRKEDGELLCDICDRKISKTKPHECPGLPSGKLRGLYQFCSHSPTGRCYWETETYFYCIHCGCDYDE